MSDTLDNSIVLFIRLTGFYGPVMVDPTDIVGMIAEQNGNTSIRCKSILPLIVKEPIDTIADMVCDALDNTMADTFIRVSGFYGPIVIEPSDVIGMIAEQHGNTTVRCKSQPPLIVKETVDAISDLLCVALDGEVLSAN